MENADKTNKERGRELLRNARPTFLLNIFSNPFLFSLVSSLVWPFFGGHVSIEHEVSILNYT